MNKNFSFENSALIILHDQDFLKRQKIAGKCVAKCLKRSQEMLLDEEAISPKDLEKACLSLMQEYNCTPTFLGYKGFPSAICCSVNQQLVHGIVSNIPFQLGDVVKVDLGATYQGAIADAATTVIYGGKPKSFLHLEMIQICNQALWNGIAQIKIGKQVGCIGNGINHIIKKSKFKLITEYGGHGIDENVPHAAPFVHNKSRTDEGVHLQAGMSLAIEPMIVIGDPKTRVVPDGWTVYTKEIGVHIEHTVFIDNDKIHVLTSEDVC